MKTVKPIRERLKLSQAALAEILGKPQSSISAYERGDNRIPPETAQTLIEYAHRKGLLIDYNHLYGDMPLPPEFKLPIEAAPPPAPTAQQLVIRRRSGIL